MEQTFYLVVNALQFIFSVRIVQIARRYAKLVVGTKFQKVFVIRYIVIDFIIHLAYHSRQIGPQASRIHETVATCRGHCVIKN